MANTHPIKLFLVLIISVFLAEAMIMLLLPGLHLTSLMLALEDAATLVLLVFPVLYLLLFKPLLREIDERKRVEHALQAAKNELETKVKERTAELLHVNEKLRLEIAVRKKTEEEIIQKEKMASLGTLAAGIAHEVNTPAGAIINVSAELHNEIDNIVKTLITVRNLPPDKLELFQTCLADFTRPGIKSNNEEELWKEKRQLYQYLTDSKVENAEAVVSVLDKFNLLDETKIAQYKDFLFIPQLIVLLDALGTINMTGEICQTSAKKIAHLVNALKYYAYTNMDKSELTNINESIENVLVLMHSKFKNQFDIVKKYGDIPPIYCTSDISQVWTNLLSNAYDAILERGNDYRGEIHIQTGEDNGNVVIKISDNGVGIPPEITSKIFDPFFTTKVIGKGVGLGLSIVTGIISKHHGNIFVSSLPGDTTFTVTLPLENGNQLE